MKKFFLSLFVFLASGGYVAYQYLSGGSAAQPTSSQTTPPTSVVLTSSIPSPTVPPQQTTSQQPSQVQTQPPPQTQTQAPTPTPTPTPKPQGQYIDGSYTGSVADAYYGNVQVQATVSGGKLIDVTFLQYPNDRGTSRYINGQAMPLLVQEAIQAQSANVSGVSGASDTSAAFRQSLGAALAQAKT
ncbi:MAG TPA: FMN-binding protein [Candidatus Paceibacterota bacterium]|nr:FMN-binding protein [Candidatus Paceibacterota bacterium]